MSRPAAPFAGGTLLGAFFGLALAACAGGQQQRNATLPAAATVASPSAPAAASPATAADGGAERGVAAAPAGAIEAQDFELDTADGDRVRLGELLGQGRVVLLSFWATWCEPCKLELPHLQTLQQRYGGQGLTVLAISADSPSSLAELRSYLRGHDVKLTVPLDLDRHVTDLYDPRMIMPYWVLLDRRGRQVRTHQGYLPGDEELLEREVLRTLNAAAKDGSPQAEH